MKIITTCGLLLSVLFSLGLFQSGCGQSSAGGQTSSLTIKGAVQNSESGNSLAARNALTVSTGEAKKVLSYRDFGIADVSDVDASGSFAINVDREPCGLVFLDESDAVVGYLSLATGIEALPLSMVDESVGEIDLKNIDFVNGTGQPEHNPIDQGGETEMNETERAIYRLQSSLFSAIIRNLDMNGDNVIDVLSDRPYWMMFGADFNAGAPSMSDPGDSTTVPTFNTFHFNFSDYHDTVASPPAILHAPDNSTYECHNLEKRWAGHSSDSSEIPVYHWMMQNGWTSFASGEYSIVYDTDQKQVAFDITSPLASGNYIFAANMWFEMNGAVMSKLHWQWKMLDGTNVDASKLLRSIILQLDFSDGRSSIFVNPKPSDTEYTFDMDEESFAALSNILINGRDHFGNEQGTYYTP